MRRSLLCLAFAGGIAAPVAAQPSAAAQDDVQARMQAWSKALGVECTHCHVADQWTDTSKPVHAFAQRMMTMVDGLNAGPMKELGGVTCWTCHRGRSIPPRLARDTWEAIRTEHAAEFEGTNRAIAMSVYAASLGVDCSHCHDADRKENTKAPKAMVARMLPIFDEIPKHFDETRRPVTQCYMCHQGKITPERSPGR